MVAKDRKKSLGSKKVEVGEIDTRAPFQSVKDAVSLFGEGAFSGEKPSMGKSKHHSTERVLAKETRLHLAQKELNKLKEQIKNAEITKAQVLVELEKNKKTMDDLNQKISMLTESKELEIKQMETAKSLAKQLEANTDESTGAKIPGKEDLENVSEEYLSLVTELNAAKKELWKIRQDCVAATGMKATAFTQVEVAELAAKINMERVGELSKEISSIQETFEQVKLATFQEQQDQAKILAETDSQREEMKATLEQSTEELLTLRKKVDPEMTRSPEAKLVETGEQIGYLKMQMESLKASDLESVSAVSLELENAKGLLKKLSEEECSLQDLVDSLKVELENVKKEHCELKEKEEEMETVNGNLHVMIQKSKSELEACLAEESKARGASVEMVVTLHQLMLENENAQREAEEVKNKAELLKNEAEATKIALKEAEQSLRITLKEAEEAKMAEATVLDEIKKLSDRTTAACSSNSELGAVITISKDEFDRLNRKVESSDKLAEMKVAAALAQVDALKASENEALEILEVIRGEIEEVKSKRDTALKRAEMAEAAKRAVEGELRKWHEKEQKKDVETVARILANADISCESSSQMDKAQKQQHQPDKVYKVHRLEKAMTSVSKKVLRSNLSVIFSRKKNQIEGCYPSYLRSDKCRL
ncbi:hypothetical protein SAY87_002923 [Trapa incisa]|uniref:WEB family protein n=1 Tax=Trapa incisa TaxID=236973 RepID=A0AAN7KRN2_9MYRT|nr:hypothetical protein SAY87_002923 [Trapa incisa]